LGYAFQNDHLAVSLDSEKCWRFSSLEVEVRYLALDGTDELVNEWVTAKHACCPEHMAEHAGWIQRRTAISIRSGSDIWDRRGELFPHLQFCASVGEQLAAVLSGDLKLGQIMKKLHLLEVFCQDWSTGAFNDATIPCKVTPESPETLARYGQKRTFRCPDGRDVVFNWHVRLTPEAWRIHFDPMEGEKLLIIGYIGPHLPTVKFK
jgi:hypothetical protein